VLTGGRREDFIGAREGGGTRGVACESGKADGVVGAARGGAGPHDTVEVAVHRDYAGRPGLGLDHHVEHAVEVHGVAGPGATTRDTGCVVVHAGNRVRLVRGDLVLRVDRRGHGQEERHRQEGGAPQVGRP